MPRLTLEEEKIENKFVTWVRHNPPLICVKLNIQGNKGYPDRMILMPNGKAIFIEFKAPGKTAYLLQQYMHREMRKLGFAVEVHDTVKGAIEFVERELEP